ncbi:MAG TPA: plastocyanin/azurin family copper-binding protein, partial [Candidatus Udaeobacter sp.]|nr:plastocyanin/azurin family copper-binding protein [Candidatus Udaeobacter sp.]
MKIWNAARLIFWVTAISALGILVRAESGQKRMTAANTSRAPLRIVDQMGRPAISGVPSGLGQTFDVTVGPDFAFHPDSINISVGDTVRWTWASSGHSVSSGPPCVPDSQYCSPNDTSCFPGTLSNSGTIYTHTFQAPGQYSYHCIAHCVLGMTGTVNVAGGCAQAGWSAGPDMPTPLVRAVGVYFQPDGNFYTMGGRTSDSAGSDFQHALQYSPTTNSWTQKASTFPDNEMNNMACGVLTVSGTPQIYCVGGSAAGQTTATGRVFSY